MSSPPSPFPTQARAVVIGGGVVGSAVAYHLCALGWRDTVLLERARLGSGTSWHAAGNMETYREDPLLGEMIRYAVDLYPRLERETGQALGWRQTGRVTFTSDPRRFSQYRGLPEVGAARGIEIELLTPAGVEEKLPIINPKGLAGGIWVPSDGRVNPTDLAVAMAKGARQNGARVLEEMPVTAINTRHGRVESVETPGGTIRCEVVVNAAGLWSARIGRLCGASIPLHAVEHFYFLTEALAPIWRDMPLFLSYDELLYGREDVGGLLFGFLDADAIPIGPESLPDDFSFGLLPENWAQAEPYLAATINRIPILETAGIRMLFNGPESFTPDGNMLLGEVPGVGGFFVAAGMNSNGIALSAGAGKLTAEWIVEGAPSLDATRLDIRRFARSQATRSYIRARAREVPSFFGVMRGAGVDYRSARGLRQGALHERLVAAGAHFSTVAGWERVDWFRSEEDDTPEECIRREQRVLEERGGLIDRSADAKLLLRGPDATGFLTRLSGSVATIEPGTGGRAILLNEHGGVEADAIAIRARNGDWWLLAEPGEQVRLGEWLRTRALPEEAVGIFDVTSGWASFELIGAQAQSLMDHLASRRSGDSGDAILALEIGSGSAWAVRDPLHHGWRLQVATEQAGHVFDAIATLAGPALCGWLARDRWRVWRCIARFGAELSPHVNAAAAGLDAWMALEGDPFIGSEAVRRGLAAASRRRIDAFSLASGGLVPGERSPVWQADRAVGFVTSCAPHHASETVALLALTEAAPDAELHLKLDARRWPLTRVSPVRA